MAKSPPLVVGGAVQIKLYFGFAGVAGFNVLHARKSGTMTIDQALANSVDAAVKSAWVANMAPLCANETGLGAVSVRDLSSPNQPEFVGNSPTVLGSDATSDSLPTGIALCVTLRTAKAGKSYTGRVYVGGFTEAQNGTNGGASQAAADGATNFVGDVKDALGTLGLVLGVLSRPSYATVIKKETGYPDGSTEEEILSQSPSRAGAITDVETVQARNLVWDTQRGRMALGGGGSLIFRAASSRS